MLWDLRNDMSKSSVYFACVLFMTAVLTVSAQGQAAMMNGAMVLNSTSNNSTSNATSNESIIVPPVQAEIKAANETLASSANEIKPVMDAVASQNASMPAEIEN